MKLTNTPLKRAILIIIGAIILVIITAILLISPITKYLVEKYDVKYTGRQIETGWVYVNPFTGYVRITDLKIFEAPKPQALNATDSLFFSAKSVSANFALAKMLFKTFEISEITLNQPKGVIIQNNKILNFNDLITKFSSKDPNPKPSSVKFNIRRITIKNGTFYYREEVIPINYFIKNVNFESSGKQWNADTIAVKFSLASGTGIGTAKGNLTINFKTLDYRIAAMVNKFDLKIIEQYLKDLTNYGTFSAQLDADINASGNFNDQENVTAKGMVAINDFHFGKDPNDDYASFEKLAVKIIELSPKNHQYLFDSLSVDRPFFKYEQYDTTNNLATMFGKKGVNITAAKANPAKFNLVLEIADYVKVLAKNFFRSNYKINKIAINDGRLMYNDFSLTEKFTIQITPLYITADSVNKNRKRVEVFLKSGIKPYGNALVTLSINPKDSSDFNLDYHIQQVPAAMFNPYLINYTSFPLDRGSIEINGKWQVLNGIIKSKNHLLIIDPRVANRLHNTENDWLPLPFLMYFVRERGNIIDYQIPITGNLKDPNFHWRDVIFDILSNIFIKPATTTYIAQVKSVETKIEKSLLIRWDMRQQALDKKQEQFVTKIADFLKDKPDASIDVYPIQYAEKEKEELLFFEAKKQYYLSAKKTKNQLLSKDDSLTIDKMSIKHKPFVSYLNTHAKDTLLFTIQEKCLLMIGSTVINNKFNRLKKERERSFMLLFKNKGIENHVKLHDSKNDIPFNGFSFFKIAYKGELPESLIKAQNKMEELNSVSPRKMFRDQRKKNRNIR